jgi:hypothetical protein
MDDDAARSYPWLAERDDRFTLALVLDVGEVLVRHGYPAPAGAHSSTSPPGFTRPCLSSPVTTHPLTP